MSINSFLEEVVKASQDKKSHSNEKATFTNLSHQEKAAEVNERIRSINVAYAQSAQDAWKYSVI